MVAKDNATRKWVTKFCDLMNWFIGVDDALDERFPSTHINGLAANYLAVKLGIAEPSDELPYTHWHWSNGNQDDPPERKQRRQQCFENWKTKAQEHGKFKRTRLQKTVTPGNIRRFCDCLRSIKYRSQADPIRADVTDLALEANDLAAKLGLTHPDWILALNLGFLSFQNEELLQSLPLPMKYAKPPIVFNGHQAIVGEFGHTTVNGLDEWIEKAESLLLVEPEERASTASKIPPKHRSAPLSLKRMAALHGGDMTARKLKAMIKNGRFRVETINRQTFVFDTRDLPNYVVEEMRE